MYLFDSRNLKNHTENHKFKVNHTEFKDTMKTLTFIAKKVSRKIYENNDFKERFVARYNESASKHIRKNPAFKQQIF